MTSTYHRKKFAPWAFALCLPCAALLAQDPTPPASGDAKASAEAKDDEMIVLSPFEVSASKDTGYTGATTLAGNRLNSEVRDLGTSVSVYNTNFLKDIGATDASTFLKYTLGSEVGGIYGNYAGLGNGVYLSPSFSANPVNRIRGLTAADNTRDYFQSSIAWDSYNIDGVDLQRGPNSILFGQGSPAGVINVRTKQASFSNSREVELRMDQWGSVRESLDFNQVLLKDELAIRFDALNHHTLFEQKPAYDDGNREYVAARWEPDFLKKAGIRTVIKVSGEVGDNNSNRPRNIPLEDHITPWFTAMNQTTFNPVLANDTTNLPGRNFVSKTYADGTANSNFQPWLASSGSTAIGNNYFGGPIAQFNTNGSNLFTIVAIPNTYLGVSGNAATAGQRDGNIGGLGNSNPRALSGWHDYEVAVGAPLSTLAKNKLVTDRGVFDYFKKLIDGPSKHEYEKFYNYNIGLTQTFFNDHFGFDIVKNREWYKSGGYGGVANSLTGGAALFADMNSVWGDGSPNASNGWYSDGTPNSGVGSPYVDYNTGWSEQVSQKDDLRATAFATYNFAHLRPDSILFRALGTHTITGLWTKDKASEYNESGTGVALTGSYLEQPQWAGEKAADGRFWADFVPSEYVYLGSSMSGKSLTHLNLDGIKAAPSVHSVSLRYFDSTWVASTNPSSANYVNPAAPWSNPVTTGTSGGPTASTQAENPANYAGWTNLTVPVVNSTDSLSTRDALRTYRQWHRQDNDAKAFVYQAKLWDDSVILTGGIRRDTVGNSTTIWNWSQSTPLGWDAASTPYATTITPNVKRNSKSWGFVTHLNSLPYLSRWGKKSPIEVSLTFNQSENFQTGTAGRSFLGEPLPLPQGHTKDYGILLETSDHRFSLRVNKFESKVQHNLSDAISQPWNYGNNIGIMAGFANRWKINTTSNFNSDGIDRGSGIISNLNGDPNNPNDPEWQVDYQPAPGESVASAHAKEIADVTAWNEWEALPRSQAMAKAWGFGFDPAGNFYPSGNPGVAFTEDAISRGEEIELNAQVTHNWRLTLNASRIKSIRNNIGGEPYSGGGTVMDFLKDFDYRMEHTAMGDLRIWGANYNAGTARDNWNGYADGDLNARLAQQGTTVPENRLWHVNLVSNYEFDSGMLKGFNVGAAIRFQSRDILAYKAIDHGTYISYDLNSPYYGPENRDLDYWVGYTRKVYRNIIWNAQLNVSNAFVGDKLVPVTVQGDGSPAGYRIRPHEVISLTNSFRF